MFNIGLKQEVKPVLLDGRSPAMAVGESVISICTAHCLPEQRHQFKVMSIVVLPPVPTTVSFFLNPPASFRIYCVVLYQVSMNVGSNLCGSRIIDEATFEQVWILEPACLLPCHETCKLLELLCGICVCCWT